MAVSGRDIIAAAALALGVVLQIGTASATCQGCVRPAVVPPTPPPPNTSTPNCNNPSPGCGGGLKVTVPPVNIPTPGVVVNYGAPKISVQTQAFANADVGVGAGVYILGGGGGFVAGGGGGGVDGGFIPMGPTGPQTTTREAKVARAIQAVCIDDRGSAHDASQTFGETQVAEDFSGEIYRCMAGTRMRALVGKIVDGKANFDGARTIQCAKNEALVYAGHTVVCQAQETKRPCNERSLLRRFGPGLKVVVLRETETVTAEQRRPAGLDPATMPLGFDGGVGGSVW
jgi:hypothetical protein